MRLNFKIIFSIDCIEMGKKYIEFFGWKRKILFEGSCDLDDGQYYVYEMLDELGKYVDKHPDELKISSRPRRFFGNYFFRSSENFISVKKF